jgi:hypothetical protein
VTASSVTSSSRNTPPRRPWRSWRRWARTPPSFSNLFDQLRLDVLDHASKEETYEFRYLRRAVAAGELRSVADVVKAAEAVAPTHPHPGVESATANDLAGPALSLFDRTKDLVRKAITTPN